MSTQQKAAVLTAVVASALVALQLALRLDTAIAGVFVFGMAAGFLIGDRMARAPAQVAPSA